ncbi:hypothetical protein CRI94_03860 [Longibacter salinarum]|uniref:AB hydrolase-1 domain-containing protein n=1 Tax=Longibacter salinarum TaxID=1850348 RepID=A0A2A8CZV9_9BACT|nr:alpha/beta fold hydrolase [Longibacter salinarum]PEN14186.1 hypothetical protein CRI94_03860 [Longibacter salinarum]
MVRFLLVLVLAVGGLVPSSAEAQPLADTSITGSWLGTLKVPDGEFRVVFHLRRNQDSELTGTMDSPDQGATGIQLSQVVRTADTLRIGVRSISGQFAGVIDMQKQTIDGQWAQGPARLPLTLRKTDEAPSIERPQQPQKPLPYRVENIQFSAPDGVPLAGTLTIPRGTGRHPGVLLIAGAGAQDRDASVAGHRPFRVWADQLTRAGFAVLRYDERGVGASEGEPQGLTTEELSRDAEAALTSLASRTEVNDEPLAVIGHSEGGTIATMIANRDNRVDAVVLLATPSVPGDDVLSDQLDIRAEANNVDDRTRAMQRGTQERIFRAIKENADSTAMANELRRVLIDSQGIRGEEVIQQEIQRLTAPWLRAFLRYDPAPALRRLDEPVLAIYGTRDTQLKPEKNARALREALSGGASSDITIREIHGLNHLLQPATTGRPGEYGRIELTVAPQVLDLVATWLDDRLR